MSTVARRKGKIDACAHRWTLQRHSQYLGVTLTCITFQGCDCGVLTLRHHEQSDNQYRYM